MNLVELISQCGHPCFASLNTSLVNFSLMLLTFHDSKVAHKVEPKLVQLPMNPGPYLGELSIPFTTRQSFHILRQLSFLPLNICRIFPSCFYHCLWGRQYNTEEIMLSYHALVSHLSYLWAVWHLGGHFTSLGIYIKCHFSICLLTWQYCLGNKTFWKLEDVMKTQDIIIIIRHSFSNFLDLISFLWLYL